MRFPTDARMYSRGAKLLVEAAAQEGVDLRQTYTKTTKNLLRATHNAHHLRRKKSAKSASEAPYDSRAFAPRGAAQIHTRATEPASSAH